MSGDAGAVQKGRRHLRERLGFRLGAGAHARERTGRRRRGFAEGAGSQHDDARFVAAVPEGRRRRRQTRGERQRVEVRIARGRQQRVDGLTARSFGGRERPHRALEKHGHAVAA